MSPSGHFADRLARTVSERRSQLVLGLDPDPRSLWPAAVASRARSETDAGALAAEATVEHCKLAIEATASSCVAVKLQLACFERLGAAGWQALVAVAAAARAQGLLVIADGKRGDVPHTARAYAEALLSGSDGPYGPLPGLEADAVTVNPLFGGDSLEPFVETASRAGAGCLCVVLSSNAGAADLQETDGREGLVYERIGRLVNEVARGRVADVGLSSVGAVVAATRPQRILRLRELMPTSVFLLPGVGAQGGRVDVLGPAFSPHPAAGLVTVSRALVDAYKTAGGSPPVAAAAEAKRLRAKVWALATQA